LSPLPIQISIVPIKSYELSHIGFTHPSLHQVFLLDYLQYHRAVLPNYSFR
jgi:hypothetical protein